MIKIVTITGARPQIIKAAAISRAIKNNFADKIKEVIVHTGQHYDENMSAVFFTELGIPQPAYNLNVGSGSHAIQTAAMIKGIEEILKKEKPNALVLYGDTNSTLAGAIVGSKMNVPVIHIEAGLRSFNKQMPEEINRIACDQASTLLFSPTKAGFDNLVKEGFKADTKIPYNADNPKIYHCGDVMYDNSLYFAEVAEKKSKAMELYGLKKNNFILATIHRDSNTDIPERLNALFSALFEIHQKNNIPVILPLHPRTKKYLPENLDKKLLKEITNSKQFIICEPLSFLDMVLLEKNCSLVMTDSGGVQKEAFYFRKPCIILRPETEWVELLAYNAAILADANKKKILDAYTHFSKEMIIDFPDLFGDGHASEFICNEIVKHFS
ncbi:MAG TPA: UDP-N-acetylglucosamine 2-epimerase (non-hydrolyzing) [Bacteroidia bacterium]|nr:UDP-N-acetylglucosamine 2-epimerase (non-hydrolyzing) [Bacteroidia bacterium]